MKRNSRDSKKGFRYWKYNILFFFLEKGRLKFSEVLCRLEFFLEKRKQQKKKKEIRGLVEKREIILKYKLLYLEKKCIFLN